MATTYVVLHPVPRVQHTCPGGVLSRPDNRADTVLCRRAIKPEHTCVTVTRRLALGCFPQTSGWAGNTTTATTRQKQTKNYHTFLFFWRRKSTNVEKEKLQKKNPIRNMNKPSTTIDVFHLPLVSRVLQYNTYIEISFSYLIASIGTESRPLFFFCLD